MKTHIPTIFKDKKRKFPDFIKKHSVFKEFTKSVKVFPKLGLKNSFEKVLDKDIKVDIWEKVYELINSLECCNNYDDDEYNRICSNLSYMLDDSVCNDDNCNDDKCISNNGDIILTSNFKFNNKDFKKGSSIFPILSELRKKYNDYIPTKAELDKVGNKEKNKIKNKFKNHNIAFSSVGDDGLWDIATMSMRGIKSCMRWGTNNSSSLVGTMIDPYAGVIYLTDNKKTDYGKQMLARAVVRFVINKAKPALLVETVYTAGKQSSKIQAISEIFRSFLLRKTNNKYKVFLTGEYDEEYFHTNSSDWASSYIPMTKQVKFINDDEDDNGYGYGYMSYRDSDIDYRTNKKYYNPEKAF